MAGRHSSDQQDDDQRAYVGRAGVGHAGSDDEAGNDRRDEPRGGVSTPCAGWGENRHVGCLPTPGVLISTEFRPPGLPQPVVGGLVSRRSGGRVDRFARFVSPGIEIIDQPLQLTADEVAGGNIAQGDSQ